MGYISVKLTDIEIDGFFKVFIKHNVAPYPKTGDTWTDYGLLLDIDSYDGSIINEMILSGDTYDFEYGEVYWIKIQDIDNSEKYIIKNVKINDEIAYRFAIPSPSITPSITPSISISPTITPSITPSISISPTITPSITPTRTPSISISPTITPSITPSITPIPPIIEITAVSPDIPDDPDITGGLINISITCTNSGSAGLSTIYWKIVNSLYHTVDSGNQQFSFSTGAGQSKILEDIYYPDPSPAEHDTYYIAVSATDDFETEAYSNNFMVGEEDTG